MSRAHRATQDGRVTVESSDKTWSTEEGKVKTLQYSCLENPINRMKRQKDRPLKVKPPGLYVTNMLPEQSGGITPERTKRLSQSEDSAPAVDATGDGRKV